MLKLTKIADRNNIAKDMTTGAILATDRTMLDEYKAKKAMISAAKESEQRLNNIQEKFEEIDELKKDIAEIKQLLRGLVK